MTEIIESVLKAKDEVKPTSILIFTESRTLMEKVSDNVDRVPITIFTPKPPYSSFINRKNVHIRHVNNSPAVGIEVLDQAKNIVLSCAAEGLVDEDDEVLLVVSADIQTILYFDMKELGIVNLRDEIEGRIDLELLEYLFNIGTKIVREGKEGFPAGALFIIGDMNNVLNKTTESVKNPLEDRTGARKNIKDKENWNTIKEFAMLDGALVIDKYGNPIAAGRYVMFRTDSNVRIEDGLGGRHFAASYITLRTDAIAMVVSSEGIIRIYKDGGKIYEVDVL